MTARGFDPLRLNVAAFCQAGAILQGRWALAALPRLAASCAPAAESSSPAIQELSWAAEGTTRAVRGRSEFWMSLRVEFSAPLQCQRCLQPMLEDLQVLRRVRFVEGEDEAARLDELIEDDVLALTARLDLRELAEDELILALPIVPRHPACSGAPVSGEEQNPTLEEPTHPFASLARLRGSGR